ncbi:MAG: glycine betaine ABC transporter substrate-binding protein [Planctomycetota bacterium]
MTLKEKLAVVGAILLGIVSLLVVIPLVIGSGGEALTAGFTAEFIERPDGYAGLTEAYGFEFAREPKQMDPGLMYKACAEGAVDVICGFATDGRIAAYQLFLLTDDKTYFPPYYAAPVVRRQALDEHPELEPLLNRLAGKLDDATMQSLNLQVDRERKPRKASAVARDFLVDAGLIDPDAVPGDGSAGTVRIGGKDFTEQNILGEMMAILIECNSDIAVERRLYLGGTMICFNALRNGDLDLYAEYTGTGLVSILDRDVITDPDEAYEAVKTAFADEWDLLWLEPFGFNNTYTLTMRRKQAGTLGIRTISDLAAYVNRKQNK